jgi:hypothetical protein
LKVICIAEQCLKKTRLNLFNRREQSCPHALSLELMDFFAPFFPFPVTGVSRFVG